MRLPKLHRGGLVAVVLLTLPLQRLSAEGTGPPPDGTALGRIDSPLGIAVVPPPAATPHYVMPPVAQSGTPTPDAPTLQPGPPASPPATPANPSETPGKPEEADAAQPQHLLDELFARLAKSTDSEESQGIAGAIERVWMHSGSDTADLLMQRGLTAMRGKDLDLAEQLLTGLIRVDPDWAEAWNQRATVRFMNDNEAGSMQDIAEVLKREPRHFGALSGMAAILRRAGQDKSALTVYRRTLELYPQQSEIRTLVDKLTIDVEGRDI